jgi:preprotein translocase subunit Sec61beta
MLLFIDPDIVLSMSMLSFIDPDIVLSMSMLLFIFVRGLFEWKQICTGLKSFVYICIAFGDPFINRGGL